MPTGWPKLAQAIYYQLNIIFFTYISRKNLNGLMQTIIARYYRIVEKSYSILNPLNIKSKIQMVH